MARKRNSASAHCFTSWSAWAKMMGATAAMALAMGCAFPTTPVLPPPGFIYTQYKGPLQFGPADEGPNEGIPVANCKEGVSKTRFISIWPLHFSLCGAWGDASFQEAVAQGKLSKVHYADFELLNVLCIYSEFVVHVYGE
ncbi:MAG: hypothetical protein NTX50_22690 [Candidatus Sumerlaeota bacterium]|nr:hypothetical protein [Candidatus Sumerlaeota bacterium]